MKWFAAHVRVNSENKTKRTIESLEHDGVKEVFIPVKDGKKLMPGYIFILSDTWPDFPVMLPGFKVLGTAEDSKVKELKKISTNDSAGEEPAFKKGDSVIFTGGPFYGLKAEVCRPGKKRSRVNLLNSEVIMDADNGQLEFSS